MPYLNSKIEKGNFILNYPQGLSYWQLVDEQGRKVMDGNYTFPPEVLAQWTDSDDVLIEDLLANEPWMPKVVEPKAIEEVVTVDAEVVTPEGSDPVTEG